MSFNPAKTDSSLGFYHYDLYFHFLVQPSSAPKPAHGKALLKPGIQRFNFRFGTSGIQTCNPLDKIAAGALLIPKRIQPSSLKILSCQLKA